MTGGFPVGFQWEAAQSTGLTASSAPTNVTCGAVNTLGAYAQLVAATTADAAWLYVAMGTGGTAVSVGFDIAVGAAGSEKVIINAVTASYVSIGLYQAAIFPVNIPAGSRIAARCQSPTSGAVGACMVIIFDDAFGSPGGSAICDTYGWNTGTSLGTSVDPGGTANTKGSYVQFSASTTADYSGFVLGFNDLGQATQSVQSLWLVDVAVGAAGSEKVILNNYPCQKYSFTAVMQNPPYSCYIPIVIPAGTRVAIRCQCNINTATPRLMGAIFYGVRL